MRGNSQAADCALSHRGGISNSPDLPKTESFLGWETFGVKMRAIQANRDPLILTLLGGMDTWGRLLSSKAMCVKNEWFQATPPAVNCQGAQGPLSHACVAYH